MELEWLAAASDTPHSRASAPTARASASSFFIFELSGVRNPERFFLIFGSSFFGLMLIIVMLVT
jgi:hypothetical protein